MTGRTGLLAPVTPALRDRPASRTCLRCATAFQSEGFGERVCKRCKAHASWRSWAPEGHATGRRSGSR